MRSICRKITLLAMLLLAGLGASAQTQAQLADCNSAQNACSNPGFTLTSNFTTGLPFGLNISNPSTNPAGNNWSGCLLTNGPGPNWMVITAGSTGMLGFSFGANGTPFPQTGFYDWAMWPYDANTCSGIFNNTLPPAACCWNANSSGGTGMGPLPAGATAGNYVPSIPVTAGQQFIILLSNYSGVTNSVTIQPNGPVGLTCSQLLLPSAIRCPGQQAAITATWIANTTNVNYTIAASMPLNAATYTVQSNPTFIVSPTSTHVYTVFASGNNTLNAVVTTSNTFTVTISPTTTMNVSAIGGGIGWDNICPGHAATLQAQSAGTNFTLVSPPPSSTVYSQFATMVTPVLTTGGTYTMSTTLFSGCTATGAVNVGVAPNNNITVSTPLNVCLNHSLALNSSLNTGSGTYVWSGPNSYSGISYGNTNVTGNPATDTIPNIQLSGAGVYSVTSDVMYAGAPGTTPTLCPHTSTVQVNVVATSPVIISASPSNTLCQGSSLNLSSSITGTAGFLWTGPNSFNASAQTATVASLLPADAGIYTVSAIFSNGAITCPITNTVNIHVVATSDPTITSLPHNVCQGQDAVVSATAYPGITGPPTYSWSGPALNSPASSTLISAIQPSASGVYYVSAIYSLGTRTCATHASGQINVVQVNTISVIPPPPVCRPDNVQLNASAPGAISYTWTGPNNFADYQANPIVFHPQTSGSGIYTVNVAFGGGALTCYTFNTVSVTINPVLNFTLEPWQQVCYDTPVHLNGPAGATSYSWTSSSGLTSDQQDIFIPAASVADGGTYTLNVALGPCITAQTSSLDVIGRIHQSYVQQSTTICKGDTITLKSEVVGGNGTYYAYTWNPSVYLNSPTGSVQAGVSPKGTTIYNVTIFDTRCPEYKESNTFVVTVLSAAQPKLTLEKTYGCEPLCLTYDSKVDTLHSIVTYDFFKNNLLYRRIQQDPLRNFCLDAGNYTLRIKTTSLDVPTGLVCSDSTDYPSQILVNELPGSDMSWTPESPTVSDNTVTFFATSKNGVVEKWNWTFGGTWNDTLNTPSPQRLFEYTGEYPVTLSTTNDLGCTDTIIRYIEIKDDYNVFIPNSFTPNGDNLNDVFQFKGTGIKLDDFSMQIYDRWGTVLFTTTDPTKGWDGTVKGQKPAPDGIYVYLIKVTGANSEGDKKYLGQVTLIR